MTNSSNSTNRLKKLISDTLADYKAEDCVILDVHDLTDIADYMFVCSGTSTRHLKALANNLIEQAKKAGFKPLGSEGIAADSDWILIDLGDIIVHCMLPETRKLYALEELWDIGFVRKKTGIKKKISVGKKTEKTRKIPTKKFEASKPKTKTTQPKIKAKASKTSKSIGNKTKKTSTTKRKKIAAKK